jgi:hypothetical protein
MKKATSPSTRGRNQNPALIPMLVYNHSSRITNIAYKPNNMLLQDLKLERCLGIRNAVILKEHPRIRHFGRTLSRWIDVATTPFKPRETRTFGMVNAYQLNMITLPWKAYG